MTTLQVATLAFAAGAIFATAGQWLDRMIEHRRRENERRAKKTLDAMAMMGTMGKPSVQPDMVADPHTWVSPMMGVEEARRMLGEMQKAAERVKWMDPQ